MFERGRIDKKHRMSAYMEHHVLMTAFCPRDWHHKLHMTVSKIKAFSDDTTKNEQDDSGF